LLVNGLPVEEYTDGQRASGDETLRELRRKPEGSYTISPQFDASHLTLHIIRKFRFKVGGNIHEVQLAQIGGRNVIWQILLDGILVERAVRTLSNSEREMLLLFTLCVASGVKVSAALHTRWNGLNFRCQIKLTVNGIEVPVCWSKAGGEVQPQLDLPEVPVTDSAEEVGQQEKLLPLTEPEEEEKEMEEAKEGAIPSTLPPGVSFDRTSGAYQSFVRGKSGRYVFLGEFGTPEEAHQQHLMALQEDYSANTCVNRNVMN
jgi:hypothetical protein